MSIEPPLPSVVRGYRALLRRPARRNGQDAATVRCPKCQAPLTARMGARGPYFHCHCPRR